MFRVGVASLLCAICAAEQTLSPDNGIQVLKKVVQEVQTNTKLTKDAKAKMVLSSIAELQDLEKHWKQAADVSGNKTAASQKIVALKKELEEKKALLAKEESQLKVVKLKKELMEKQTKLRHLMKMKAKIEQEEKALKNHKSTGKNMVADMKELKLLREQAKNIAIA